MEILTLSLTASNPPDTTHGDMKTSGTKKVVKIFCKAFMVFKKIFCLRHPGLNFIFKKRLFKFPSS
jgi:hypothetical protein